MIKNRIGSIQQIIYLNLTSDMVNPKLSISKEQSWESMGNQDRSSGQLAVTVILLLNRISPVCMMRRKLFLDGRLCACICLLFTKNVSGVQILSM